ncbi:MAG: LamB/YcsF family protein [Bacteroidetes bacterium]|nr:MAG: LamB/YcsF family protein [Bacteroidota bacterium]
MNTQAALIDLNCDMGESYGRFQIGNDEAIFPYISSSNIACGFHGGDPLHIENTIRLALKHRVRIGAHPSYPDLSGFGRRKMHLPAAELEAVVKYQVAALKGMVESHGATLAYVKPHGALYNTAADEEETCRLIISAIQALDPRLALMGLAGSTMEQVARQQGIEFIAEAFADRTYTPQGRLLPRSQPHAVIYEPEQAVKQVLDIALRQHVLSAGGLMVPVHAQSICIHGDNPAAVPILQALHAAFETHHIQLINQRDAARG